MEALPTELQRRGYFHYNLNLPEVWDKIQFDPPFYFEEGDPHFSFCNNVLEARALFLAPRKNGMKLHQNIPRVYIF